jgi:hypothetical protein
MPFCQRIKCIKKTHTIRKTRYVEGYVVRGIPKNGGNTFCFKKNGSNNHFKISNINKADQLKSQSLADLKNFYSDSKCYSLTIGVSQLLDLI